MTRHVRFIVHQRLGRSSRPKGLFTAAYFLREGDDLSRCDRERLERILRWFETELPVPRSDAIPEKAIFWYTNAGPFSRPMWQLARFLEEHRFTTELITLRYVGRIVYQDDYQLAAVPPTRRHR